MTDCYPRVKRIRLTVEPDNDLWGFPQMLNDMRDWPKEQRIEAVIDLVNEDFMTMFEGATWEVDFV